MTIPSFTVTVTPPAAHSIGVMGLGGCTTGGTQTVTSDGTSGAAVFSAVTITVASPPMSCTIDAYDNTNTSVGVITSAPFNVNAPMPVLSFQSQPSTTTSGMTMTSFVVSHTGTLSGSVGLTANNCAGVSFSGLTATISGTTATFNMVVPTSVTTVNGCTFTASAAGATSATSNTFNINGVPVVPVLTWIAQPTTTVTGTHFTPPIAVSVSPLGAIGAPGYPVTISVSGGCTVTGTTTVTSEPAESNTPGVALFNLSAGNVGTNCVMTASAPNAISIMSGPFTINDTPPLPLLPLTRFPVPRKP
jgi:hypothetical protein